MSNAADTSRNKSGFWGKIPLDSIINGLVDGVYFEDDFSCFPLAVTNTTGNISKYQYFTSAASPVAIADAAEFGGALTFGADGADEAASLQSATSAFKINRSNGVLVFEARIKASTITAGKNDFFLGLAVPQALSATVPIDASDLLADTNICGFIRSGGTGYSDGASVDFVYKADGVTRVIQSAAVATLVAATYIKLGFVFDPNTYLLTTYVDGLAAGTAKTIPTALGTDFPNDIALAPLFAVQNQTGTSPGNNTIDWWAGAQLGV